MAFRRRGRSFILKMKKTTVPDILEMKKAGRKIPALAAYSFSMARILDDAGIPIILVGDSAGMVEAGYGTTLPVTMEQMIYHAGSVARGARNALVVADMPFSSYQVSVAEAKRNAARLVKEGNAEAVKLEGGKVRAETVRAIVEMDLPVMGHIGLTPQSVHRMGGYRVQGRSKTHADILMEDARAIEDAGAFSIVLEGIPAALAREITASLGIPTIGIGAGPDCDGQVLVANDMLGLDSGLKPPKFVKRYADLRAVITKAAAEFMREVEQGEFPDREHSY